MAAICFCGCGREIKGFRRRATNDVAKQMSQDLAVLSGAIERAAGGPRTGEAQQLADEGAAVVDEARRLVHGEVDRQDVDRSRLRNWANDARSLAADLVTSAPGPSWAPDDPRTNHLAHAGERARGVITDVRKDGWGNDQVSVLAMSVAARTSDGTLIELERSLSIRSDMAPRVGDHIDVAYDPTDLSRFVYRPIVELPGEVGQP